MTLRPLALAALAAPLLAGCATYGDYAGGYAPGYGGNGYESGYGPGYGAVSVRSVDDFYGPLSAYGSWRSHPRFGRVWAPRVARDWRPYTLGRWGEDRSWISDEPFGWATYHYGRWAFDAGYGWLWVPDTTWGPSWVDWREADDHYGWAPLPPYGWGGSSISLSWIYAPRAYAFRPQVWRYAVDPGRAQWLHQRSRTPDWRYRQRQDVAGRPDGWRGDRPRSADGAPGQSPDWRGERPRAADGAPIQRPDWRADRQGRPAGERPAWSGGDRSGWQGRGSVERPAGERGRGWRGPRAEAQPTPSDPVAASAPGIAREAPTWPNAGAQRWQAPGTEVAQGGFAPQAQRFRPPPAFEQPQPPRAEAPRPEPRPELRYEPPRPEPQREEALPRLRDTPERQPE